MSAVVEFEEVVAVAGSFPVLTGIDLRVDQGEVVLLRGENGAGKTSFLRACAGLISVSSGGAHVLGFDMRVDRRAPRRYIGLLGHENNLYRDLWVREHVEFRATAAGAAESDTDAALIRVGVSKKLWTVPIGSLSAGQRRKVAIASLVVGRPRLWLLDEPHASLDTESRENLDLILAEASQLGATIIFASHESPLTQGIASRVITMGGGRVLEDSGAS